ncbi:MAG: TIGR02556 family CRISPR-associated protein [Aquificae bacterium]|nr:TIGR02556 family CRISPR-associated protein [Aquificota bacterium]
MLEAVKQIGEILLEKEKKEPLEILIENPDSNGTYKIVWALEFDKDLNFQGITEEELKAEDYKIYLYKRGTGANSPDFSPTSRITEPEKTFVKKTIRWFENHKEIPEFEKILDELTNHKKEIIEKLNRLNQQSRDSKIITVKIGGRYLYEIEIFRQTLISDYFQKITEVKKENGVCSICGEKKDLVFATSQLYTFFTTDKECYIAGGFSKKDAWKNFPVCKDCFLKADFGRKFIENNLKFKFYSRDYYLIPHLILDTKEALEEINEILSFDRKNIKSLSKEEKKKYFADKDEILDIVKDYKDIITFYFLFLKGGSTADKDRILLLVEDVLPSRIHKVFEVKEKVENTFNIDNYTFGKINQFLTEFDKLLFEVIDKIFREGKLDYKAILKIFIKKIRQHFTNSSKDIRETLSLTKDATANIFFFKELSLINFEDGTMEKSRFDEIFEKVGGALNTPAKRGIFLLGALTQMLLNIQGAERESTPFWKQLKGLKMNEEDIKGLLPKVINKLQEYGKLDKGKKELAKEISKYLLQQEKFGLTTDEINFYFVAGMSFADEIKDKIYQN